jgi:hypothetical protein
MIALCSCATHQPLPEKYHSTDIYQYNLNESAFKIVQQELNFTWTKDGNVSISHGVLNSKKYWKFINNIEEESFISSYNYGFLKCNVESSIIHPANNLSNLANCSTSINFDKDKSIKFNLALISHQGDNVTYVLAQINSPASQKATLISYNPKEDYLIILLDNQQIHQLILVNFNQLDIPWTYYKKTPQEDNGNLNNN